MQLEVKLTDDGSDDPMDVRQVIIDRLRGAGIRLGLHQRGYLVMYADDAAVAYARQEASADHEWTSVRSDDPIVTFATGCCLADRTRILLQLFDVTTKDPGDAERYAQLMADLLTEWVGME